MTGIAAATEFALIWRVASQPSAGRLGLRSYIFHDLTEHRRAEEDLSESESRFRIMADCCPTLMWVTVHNSGFGMRNQ
jgi:PAS domain-containing protein